jgi:hypothetical protein
MKKLFTVIVIAAFVALLVSCTCSSTQCSSNADSTKVDSAKVQVDTTKAK